MMFGKGTVFAVEFYKALRHGNQKGKLSSRIGSL